MVGTDGRGVPSGLNDALQGRSMNEIERLLFDAVVPGFYRARYNFSSESVENVREELLKALRRRGTLERIKSGSTVAITAGSREINNIVIILRTLIDVLKERGAKPFVFPAMGSHGGATVEGQREILEGYGITEKSMGVPLKCSMETVEVGRTIEDLPVHADKIAMSADYIIPVGRIKPHTEFKGRYESGLMKMLAIGLGKQHGANMCHKLGMPRMPENIEAFGNVLIEKCSIPFGIGIIENAFHGTYSIDAIPAEKIAEEEPMLLEKAKRLVPILPFEKVDVLICEEMGKEISGTGMDANVIGRSVLLGVSKPFIERIGIFSLTDKTNGNFNGVALGDAISKKLLDKMSFENTYPNTITAFEPMAIKIPAVMPSDKMCFYFCLKTCLTENKGGTRVVWIKNTLSLDSFFISESLLFEARRNSLLNIEGDEHVPGFNNQGDFIGFLKKENETYAFRK